MDIYLIAPRFIKKLLVVSEILEEENARKEKEKENEIKEKFNDRRSLMNAEELKMTEKWMEMILQRYP